MRRSDLLRKHLGEFLESGPAFLLIPRRFPQMHEIERGTILEHRREEPDELVVIGLHRQLFFHERRKIICPLPFTNERKEIIENAAECNDWLSELQSLPSHRAVDSRYQLRSLDQIEARDGRVHKACIWDCLDPFVVTARTERDHSWMLFYKEEHARGKRAGYTLDQNHLISNVRRKKQERCFWFSLQWIECKSLRSVVLVVQVSLPPQDPCQSFSAIYKIIPWL